MTKMPKEYPKKTSYYLEVTFGSKYQEEYMRDCIEAFMKALANQCNVTNKHNKVYFVEKEL